MDPANFYDFDDPKDKAPLDLDDLDDKPTPWYRRPKLWILTLLGCAVLGVLGSFAVKHRVASGILDLAARKQYDSAWAALDASKGSLSSCKRSGLVATLAHMDPRADTILFNSAESLKMCFVSSDSLLRLAALGNLRILDNAKGLDSSKQWTLQSMAFGAASRCIGIDSANRRCYQLGDQALQKMQDTEGRIRWLEIGLHHLPGDSLIVALHDIAKEAGKFAPPPYGTDSAPLPRN